MSLIKKVSIVLVCVMVFSFCMPEIAMAKSDSDGIGGKLLEPVIDLVVSIGDAMTNIVHRTTISQSETLISVDMVSGTLRTILTVLVGIAAAVIAIVAVVATAGAVAAVLGPVLAGLGVSIGTLSAGAVLTAGLIGGGLGAAYFYNADFFPDTLNFPIYTITADKIFANEVALFDVNFFEPQETVIKKEHFAEGENSLSVVVDGVLKTEEKVFYEGDVFEGSIVQLPDGTNIGVESIARQTQKTIATWYTRLRDIAIVALLSILVYVGIRILLSSTSNDKAKYKQMILDWIIALCLLFVMQYIMSFANIVVNKITDLVKSSNDDKHMELIVQYDEKIIESIANYMAGPNASDDDIDNMKKTLEEGEQAIVKEMGSDKVIIWDTDFLGYARFEAQMAKAGNANYAGYAVCYVVLVCFTIFFVFTYLKRVIYMAFLTIIAPLVAMTYPIDKINDGKAQAFNMWLKEYIFNLLIQPLHLLLYTILVTSAFELASKNIVYALVALGFMIPAEKLMRKFFGFEKAQTPGMLAGPAGAAMMMAGMNKLLSKGPKGGKDGSGKGGNSGAEKDDSKIRQKDDFDPDAINAGQMDTNSLEDGRNKEALQAMSDADYDNNFLDADMNERAAMDANAREAYGGDNKGMEYTDEEMEAILRDSGHSDEEIAEYMKDYNKDENSDKPDEIDEHSEQEPKVDTNETHQDNVENSSDKSKGSLRKAIGRSARYYGRGITKKMANGLVNGHLGRKALRMAGGAALGTVTGAMGLAAGIASGDPSKALQYTGAAVYGGYKLGSGTVNKTVNALDVEGTDQVFKENYYGKDEYKERQIQKEIRQKQNDLELRWKLEDKLKSKDAADKYMKEALPEVTRYGDFDNKTIVAMAQMEAEGVKRNETIAAALISERDLNSKDSNNLGDKAATEFEKTMKRKGKERGLDGDNLDKFVNRSVGNVNKLDRYRYK